MIVVSRDRKDGKILFYKHMNHLINTLFFSVSIKPIYINTCISLFSSISCVFQEIAAQHRLKPAFFLDNATKFDVIQGDLGRFLNTCFNLVLSKKSMIFVYEWCVILNH